MDVEFDNWYSEKSLHESNAVENTLAELAEKDLSYEKMGLYGLRW